MFDGCEMNVQGVLEKCIYYQILICLLNSCSLEFYSFIQTLACDLFYHFYILYIFVLLNYTPCNF